MRPPKYKLKQVNKSSKMELEADDVSSQKCYYLSLAKQNDGGEAGASEGLT
jgi:hypothetical protein